MRLSTLVIVAGFGGFTSAAPGQDLAELNERSIQPRACFKSGRKWDGLEEWAISGARSWCKNYYEGTYERGNTYTRYHDIYYKDKKPLCIEFKVGLKGKNAPKTKWLGWEECLSGLRNEIVSCGRGGQTTYGNWYYRADPNDCK